MTWEQRWHPLREEWVIIAAHRNHRPWSGEILDACPPRPPRYAQDCHLCPGNARVGGVQNSHYTGVWAFDNDHPCVGPHAPTDIKQPAGILRNRPATGRARVVCYSPRHDLTLPELEIENVVDLLKTWKQEFIELGNDPKINHVLIFENKGEAVGVSNPHPHSQIYATNFVFKFIQQEAAIALRHWKHHSRVLFEEIIDAERRDGRRIISENDSAIAFIPYFARWAYETYVAPKARHLSIATLDAHELRDLAQVLQDVTTRFDNLWQRPFPYVCALHQAPTDGRDHEGFHFHIEFHPPLRKPTLLKYLAGPEIGGGNFLSDTAPEAKAEELRSLSTVHYTRSAES